MTSTAVPDLERSTSTTTATSTGTEIKEKPFRHLDVPAPITEADEDDNVGYAAYKQGLAEHREITDEENRRIRWRIDLIILPIFLITQTLQFLDVSHSSTSKAVSDTLRRKRLSTMPIYSTSRRPWVSKEINSSPFFVSKPFSIPLIQLAFPKAGSVACKFRIRANGRIEHHSLYLFYYSAGCTSVTLVRSKPETISKNALV